MTPNLSDIGTFDEVAYIERGRTVGVDNLPPLNQYPLAVFFFRLTYIPVQSSDFWLVHSCSIGRFFLLILLWISSFTVAKRLAEISNPSLIASPLMMIGFLLVSPVPVSLAGNAAHALFAALSAFALGYVILWYGKRRLSNLWMASGFVSLALLSRMAEGTLLFASLLVIPVVLVRQAKRVPRVLAAVIIPFVIIVGGYMIMYYSLTQKSPLGTGDYLYMTFEDGHGQAHAEKFPGLNRYVEGEVESRRVFGTPEENQYSVITAIRRNPTAYFERIPRLAKLAVSAAGQGFGGPVSVWFFLLAIQGCIELVRRREFLLLGVLVSWLSYLVIYILLVFQTTHLLLPFYVVFCLASIGLTAVVSLSSKERYVWSAALLGLVVLTIGREPVLSLASNALGMLIGIWIVWTVLRHYVSVERVIPAAFVFLFSMMSLFSHNAALPKMRRLGIAPDEQAMLFLKRNYVEGSAIAAYPAIIPWAAKMKRVSLVNRRSQVQSEQDLQQWIIDNDIKAIYVDRDFRRFEASVAALIEGQVGKSLETVFSSQNREIEILSVNRGTQPTRQ